LGKKVTKKNKFNISTPVDIYKSEFLKNSNLTYMRNLLDSNNLFISKFNNTTPVLNYSNVDFFLNTKKSNYLESGKASFFKNDLLFISSVEDRTYKQVFFKQQQPVSDKKNTPLLNTTDSFVKT